jgi:hypothetical protein
MVLMSPPPTPIEDIRAERILVVAGEFDLPAIRRFVTHLPQAFSGNTELHTIAWAGHTGYAFRPQVARLIASWLGGNPSNIRMTERLALLACMFVFSIALGCCLLTGPPVVPLTARFSSEILSYAGASLMAYAMLGAGVVVLAWLKLFATDYLLSFVLITGATICLARAPLVEQGRLLHAALAAAYLIVVPIALVGSEVVHTTLSDGRWWRFPVIAAATLPLAVADETYLRQIRPWWKAAWLFFLTRIVLGAFIATGVLTLNRSDGFLVLIVPIMVLFWMLLWFAGEPIRRHTRSSLAAAVFSALVQGWVFAATLVIT